MGIKEILRRIWLISENKVKPSESIWKQSSQTQTQVIIVTIILTLISSVFRIEIRKGWICGNLITKEVLEIRNPWGRTVWKGNDVTAELTERKKKSLGISRDIEGGFYVSKEDFVKVS